jgi:hypothetical protein
MEEQARVMRIPGVILVRPMEGTGRVAKEQRDGA